MQDMKETQTNKHEPNFLTIKDLRQRWKCGYTTAMAFMHRKGSGAIKIGRKFLVTEKEVLHYEKTMKNQI